MNTFELKKEQARLAEKMTLKDGFKKINLIAGADCHVSENKLLACVVICKFPSFEIIEKKTYLLNEPLPYKKEYLAYRNMPAIIEAFNRLEEEPDLIIVNGQGINHPRKIGLATHLGLALNKPTIGISQKLETGKIVEGKIIINNEIRGFELKTKEHANPIYISPGHLCSLGSALKIISECINLPHKIPEPLHLAKKICKNKVKKNNT